MTVKNVKVEQEEVPAETLDLVVTEKSVGFLETNIETLEELVEKRLEDYKPENYMGDADLAKKDRAELNKAREKIGRARKDLIAELMKPYNDFEERCKALERKIDLASKALDEIVKIKENEEKQKKEEIIKNFWEGKGCTVVPLEKVFNPKWLNKTFKESDILAEMDARIKKVYDDLKLLEKFTDDAETLKAHYLMTLDIEETFSYGDELQRQREIAQKEAEERAEREHQQKLSEQKDELWREESNKERTQEIKNLADMALNGGVAKAPCRKEFVVTVRCFDEDLLKLKAEMNGLGIEYSVEELTF